MERFGRYVLLERIACGGMAEVFRAASLGTAGFSKLVAIKRILPHMAADPACVSMLIDEANIASTLNHPNILQVQDLGQEKSTFFITMEFVAGAALNAVVAAAIRKGIRLPLEFCFYAVGQALQGLAYAHEKSDPSGQPMNIIHRDVSPQNIMVAYDGSVKLADFGIAKAADRATHTRTGTLKGKAAYMAPEQVEGKGVDQRVDIYAMGVVLHELVAMKRLRRADSDAQILFHVIKGDYPRFSELGIPVPEDAAEVVYRALAVNPAQRWPDARSFVEGVDQVSRAQGWHWNGARVAELMRQLFPEEQAKELQSQAFYQAQLAQLSAKGIPAGDGPLNLPGQTEILALGDGDGRTTVTSPGASSAVRLPLVAAALLALASAGAAGAWALLGNSGATASASAARPGTLVVETTPAGATVLVAGKPVDGVSPVVVTNLAEGPLEVEARLAGMKPAKQVVTIVGGKAEKVRLELAAGSVEVPVSSKPAGATVSLDGKPVGKTPTKVVLQGAEAHTLSVELAGFATVRQDVLAARAPASLEFTLTGERVAPAPRASGGSARPASRPASRGAEPGESGGEASGGGKLTLQSSPWARIFIDGKDTGLYTPKEVPVAAGKHTVKLVNDEEGLSESFTVSVKPGASLTMTKQLR